jgi:hypothetical protein
MNATPTLRLLQPVGPRTGGHQQLFDRILEWFDGVDAPDLRPEVAEAHRPRILNQELWGQNWEPYEKPPVAAAPEA